MRILRNYCSFLYTRWIKARWLRAPGGKSCGNQLLVYDYHNEHKIIKEEVKCGLNYLLWSFKIFYIFPLYMIMSVNRHVTLTQIISASSSTQNTSA